MRFTKIVMAALLAAAPAATVTMPAAEARTLAKQAAQTAPSAQPGARLHRLFEAEWDFMMAQEPLWASSLGDRRFNDRWKDYSNAARKARAQHYKATLASLKAIDRGKLSVADQLNYDLFKRDLDTALEDIALGTDRMLLSHMGGVHTAHDMVDSLRFETVKDYEDWIARLNAFPAYLSQNIALLKEGQKAGMMPPRAILSRIPEQLALQMPAKAEESPFYKPFEKMAREVSAADQARLRARAQAAIAQKVIPAYKEFEAYFTQSYLPASPEKVGLRNLPNGDKLYAFYARYYTTSSMSPHRIHELGLSEVARIRREMEGIMAKVGFKGTLNEFFAHLKQEKRFFRADADALLMEYRALSRKIDPLLVKLFKVLPRAPYAVEAVPAELAPNSSAAYYMQPAADGSRPGTFYVNLYKPEKRPTYEMTALALHETVPGHHLQIALAQEQGELPKFRRYGGYTAFIEGWGLYSESLGYEMGLYDDPYTHFGKLNMEMRRALRLVLDTGMHYEGWDREKSIKFFLENAAKTELEATNEVDRYLAWPGQALAYKVGEIKIQELRARAKAQLGSRFDLPEYHHLVLSQGALPLDILERRVDAWIQAKKK